jgi:hypothetical protein
METHTLCRYVLWQRHKDTKIYTMTIAASLQSAKRLKDFTLKCLNVDYFPVDEFDLRWSCSSKTCDGNVLLPKTWRAKAIEYDGGHFYAENV